MSSICIGFIFAIILAVLALIWIAYCMFCRERHKSELYQYNISDLKYKQGLGAKVEEEKKEAKGLSAGIFILPSRRKHKDDEYEKRPDYPESPVPNVQSGTEDFIKMFTDDSKSPDVSFEIDSNSQFHSEV